MVVPLTALFAWGEQLFLLIFGPDWGTAGCYAGWLIVGAAVQFIYSPISLMLLATNSQHVNLAIQMIILVGKLGAIFFGYLNGDPFKAVIMLSLTDMCCYSFGLLLVLRQVKRFSSMI